MLEENSRWTVLPRRSCEDRIGAFVWLEQQDHHVLPSVGDDNQCYQLVVVICVLLTVVNSSFPATG